MLINKVYTMKKAEILKKTLTVRESIIENCHNALPKDHAVDMDFVNQLIDKVEEDYRTYLSVLWGEISQNDKRSLDDILDKRYNRLMIAHDYVTSIESAHKDAREITLWERLTNSNGKDIQQMNALIIAYSKDILAQITQDFMEDVK